MTRRVLVSSPDLFFATKIAATAEAAGVAIEMLPAAALPDRCRAEAAALIILDLGAGASALAAARTLKADPVTCAVPIVGFYSHVESATRETAIAAGIDHVLPRSAFVARLPELLVGAAPAL